MQRYDQFRSFFPGHVSADQRIEENNRKRSQVSSNSQSQDFIKSQSTHFHTSLSSGSTGDSQASFTNQYNDMLASSRHAENKEKLETLLKEALSSTSLISTQQTALSSCINQLHALMKAVNEIKDKQDAQDKLLMDLKLKISELFFRQDENYARIESRLHLKQTFAENEVESSSQDGMSLSAYFSSRTKRGRRDGATEGRTSSQASLDLSLTPTAELTGLCVGQKRTWSDTHATEDTFRSPSRAPPAARQSISELHQTPAPSEPLRRSSFQTDAQPELAVDGSAGLLFDDF